MNHRSKVRFRWRILLKDTKIFLLNVTFSKKDLYLLIKAFVSIIYNLIWHYQTISFYIDSLNPDVMIHHKGAWESFFYYAIAIDVFSGDILSRLIFKVINKGPVNLLTHLYSKFVKENATIYLLFWFGNHSINVQLYFFF